MNKYLIILILLITILFSANTNYCDAQWVQCDTITYRDIRCLAAIDNNIFAGTLNRGIYVTTNNGISWTQTSLNNRTVRSLFVNGTNLFAGTAGQGIYISTNTGITWAQTSLNNKDIYSFALSGNNFFAGSFSSGVYISTNNGLNWSQTSMTNGDILSVGISGTNICAGTFGNGIYISTNNGTTWNHSSLANSVVSCLFNSGNYFYAGGSNGVLVSTDNGLNWSQTSLNNKDIRSFILSGNTLFAGAVGAGVYVSTNNGTSWIQRNEGFSGGLSPMCFLISNNLLFAGTDDRATWRRPLSQLVGIQIISTGIPSKYSLSQNYPNPFNPSTNVKFSIVKAGDVKVVVYDVQGREVQTLVNERMNAGTYEVKFDGSSLNSGVYFCKMVVRHGGSSTGDFTVTKRMILIK